MHSTLGAPNQVKNYCYWLKLPLNEMDYDLYFQAIYFYDIYDFKDSLLASKQAYEC